MYVISKVMENVLMHKNKWYILVQDIKKHTKCGTLQTQYEIRT